MTKFLDANKMNNGLVETLTLHGFRIYKVTCQVKIYVVMKNIVFRNLEYPVKWLDQVYLICNK